MNIAVVSGGFDPLHSGHIKYINSASKHGDFLIILLNSDKWLVKKKGKFFLPFAERKIILENLKAVDLVLDFLDDEIGSSINGLKKIQSLYPKDQITFCNGGDRNSGNIPEESISGISFQFSVGGDDKMNSSSWILKEWKNPSETRVWGKFYNLFQDNNLKLKELIVQPGKGMSFQKHFHRDEIWLVSRGKCLVNYSKRDPNNIEKVNLSQHEYFIVSRTEWHQITNPFEEPCHIIEIQYGEKTIEEDIERLYYFKQ